MLCCADGSLGKMTSDAKIALEGAVQANSE